VHSGRLLLTIEGVVDRTAAESLRGTVLLVDVDPDERTDDPDEFSDHQLEGLDVVTVDGKAVGRLEEVLHPSAQDLLVVRRPDGTEALIPFVRELVPTVDLAARRVVVDPVPGLLEGLEDIGD
jgi:16S rRNA processing protein RimM